MRVVFSGRQEGNLVDATIAFLTGMQSLGEIPPYAILISLVHVGGASLDRGRNGDFDETPKFDRDIVHISEVILNEVAELDREIPLALKPAFDEIANAAGRPTSPNFDAEGHWIRQAD